MLAVPLVAGLTVLGACTDVGDGGPTTPGSSAPAPALNLGLDEALARELLLLDDAQLLRLRVATAALTAHVDALRKAGAVGELDPVPRPAPTRAGFVNALDRTADKTQRAVPGAQSGSDAALLASVAASDAALAASLRGSRG